MRDRALISTGTVDAIVRRDLSRDQCSQCCCR
jgi:hypothetical protein